LLAAVVAKVAGRVVPVVSVVAPPGHPEFLTEEMEARDRRSQEPGDRQL
jgi:hypothetical protein